MAPKHPFVTLLRAPALGRPWWRHSELAGQAALRPPWAVETDFATRCTRCGECIAVCPAGILQQDELGYPQIDFSVGACDFCAKCVSACPSGALQRTDEERLPGWALKAQIESPCLLEEGVVCRHCANQCPADAIRLPNHQWFATPPVINVLRCVGCGACVAPCPLAAIRMVRFASRFGEPAVRHGGRSRT